MNFTHLSRLPLVAGALLASVAHAGAVGDQFRSGAFGLPWSARAAAIEAKYPGGQWSVDEQGRRQYCAKNRQTILKLPAQHQTRELCFLIGSDGTLASATARMDATLPALLAIVNRARTLFGDFDSVRRDEGSIQSRFTYMLWTKDRPFVVQVGSANDSDGAPKDVTFTVADDAALHAHGANSVTHRPVAANSP
jgi:hypothetical protein